MKLIKVTLLLAACAMFALPSFAVTLNEIRVDQASSDYEEYVELMGMPGESLDGVFLVVLGDGTLGKGVVESVTDFTGYSIGADGYFLAVEGGTWGTNTTCEDAIDMDAGTTLNFENGDDVTYFLVTGFNGTIQDDCDLEDDGVQDVFPWDSILDSVAIDSPYESAQLLYSDTIVGPDGSYAPGMVLVCDGTWFVGDYDLCVNDTPGFSNIDACSVPTEDTNFDSLKAMYR